jgi:peptide deformylase
LKLEIRRNGDPVLREKCKPVIIIDEEIKKLANDMLETMYSADGVGLAAPQVGMNKRLFVIDAGNGPLIMINPRILLRIGEENGREGCLSIPGLWGEVTRAQKVDVEAMNLQGEKVRIQADGLLARAIQHEFDHLNGVLFIDKAIQLIDASSKKEE